jgi:hypothetical protein
LRYQFSDNDTVEKMLAKLDLRKPGARMHIESVYKAHERAMGNGEWQWDTCYTLDHTCVSKELTIDKWNVIQSLVLVVLA